MEKIINIEVLKNNIEKLSKTLPSLNIDRINSFVDKMLKNKGIMSYKKKRTHHKIREKFSFFIYFIDILFFSHRTYKTLMK